MRVAIVGGGSSAHVLAVLLSGRGHEVRILTSRPMMWSSELELETKDGLIKGRIKGAGNDEMLIVGSAQVVVFCMPVHQYPVALERIMPVLAQCPEIIVGTVYGQAGFDRMVQEAAQRRGCPVPRHFAIGLLPWIARTLEYGKRAISYGPKMRNGIATSDQFVFDCLQDGLLDDLSLNYWGCGKFEHVPNFLTLTLTVDNQIIHPSRCYALTQETLEWRTPDDIPYFYRDWDDLSSEVLKGIDNDYTVIRKAIFKVHPEWDNAYNLNYLGLEHWSYGSHNPDIKASFVNSATLSQIKPPIVQCPDGLWRLDVEHRFFKDDFAFGLEVAKSFARDYACNTPSIDKLLSWFDVEIRPRQRETQ